MRSSLNISLPEDMKDWVDKEVQRAGFSTTSEYFRHLVREAQRRRTRDEIDAKLMSAINSKEWIEMTPEWREEQRQALARRIRARKGMK